MSILDFITVMPQSRKGDKSSNQSGGQQLCYHMVTWMWTKIS